MGPVTGQQLGLSIKLKKTLEALVLSGIAPLEVLDFCERTLNITPSDYIPVAEVPGGDITPVEDINGAMVRPAQTTDGRKHYDLGTVF